MLSDDFGERELDVVAEVGVEEASIGERIEYLPILVEMTTNPLSEFSLIVE